MNAISVRQAETKKDAGAIRELFWEYLAWANDMNDKAFGLRLDIVEMLEADMGSLDKFSPPHGRLLLARGGELIAGCICLINI